MNYFKTLLILSLTLMLSACDSDSGGDDDSVVQALTGSPDLAGYLKTEEPAKEDVKQVAVKPSTKVTENGVYRGRTNPDRPTWYFSKTMRSYPSTFTVSVPGCSSFQVTNNGRRYEAGGYIVKQSDVSGRGLALLAPSSCGSKSASISYIK